MKVTCDRPSLVDALNLISGAVAARTPRPVLECVLLDAGPDTLTLTATDLEVTLKISTASVKVESPGQALIRADKLTQIVRESVDPTLVIETDGDVTHIRAKDSHFQIYGHPTADFPPVPEFEGEADFQLPAADLSGLLTLTTFATARENSRYAVNGVLIERENDKLSLVATDGRRLAFAKSRCKASNKDNRSAIVPTKALNLVQRIFGEPEQAVRVKVADNRILFSSDDAVLTSNLVEGNFPPYRDVIPRDADKKATLDSAALASAFRRAALLTTEDSKGVRMSFADSKLTLSSRAPEMGEATIDLDVPEYSGDPIEIGFNPQFILDALKVIADDQVQLELKSSNKAGVLKTGPDFVYVIMPVNLQ